MAQQNDKVMALSYSRLNVFEQCEARFDYQYISKRVVDQQNEASAYGDRVHGVLEQYGQHLVSGTPMPELSVEGEQTIAKWGALVTRIASRPGKKYFEHQMAVNIDLKPVGWFDGDVWIRGIADLLTIDGDTAYCLDYKTGKIKDDPTQLQLFALMVFWHFPQVERVKTAFIWLKFDTLDSTVYKRLHMDSLWQAVQPRFARVQEVIELGVFKAKPSGLCPWCPAQSICPDARLRR
jgi:RecB family exonuclease